MSTQHKTTCDRCKRAIVEWSTRDYVASGSYVALRVTLTDATQTPVATLDVCKACEEEARAFFGLESAPR